MLQRLHRRLGTAGLAVAVVALIAALGGTALAASGALTGKQKKEVEKIAKKFAGKPGADGAAGPAGPAGPAGSAGANGSAGTAGAKGATGPTGGVGVTGAAGVKGTTGPTGVTGATGVTGVDGTTGPTGGFGGQTIDKGVTETGYWSFSTSGGTGTEAWSSFSFPQRIANDNPAASNYQVHYVESGTASTDTVCGKGDGGAGGTVNSPKAPEGFLCIYVLGFAGEYPENATYEGAFKTPSDNGVAAIGINQTGAVVKFGITDATEPAFGAGTWALTGNGITDAP